MPSFFLAFFAAAVATVGGREALRVARLSAALGRAAALIVAVNVAAIGSCLLAAWLGAGLAGQIAPAAKSMLVAIVLFLAALELLFVGRMPAPKEPTWSFGAIVLVLVMGQLTGGAGFLVFALAVATGSPAFAAAGGAAGIILVLSLAWSSGEQWERRLPVLAITRTCAALFMLASATVFLNSRGLIG